MSKQNQPISQNQPITCYLVMSAFICGVASSFQFGYNLAVINAPQIQIKKYFHDVKSFNHLIWPLAVSLYSIGGIFGSFIGPYMAKRIGRKRSLMLNNLLSIAGGILLFSTKASRSVVMLCFGRIILGLNAGINMVVSSLYLSEIAPVRMRGAFGTMTTLGFDDVGILFANIHGLSFILGNENGWPYLLGITAIISVLQLMALPFIPESPRWTMVIKNNEKEAVRDLQMLRRVQDVSEEIEEIKREALKNSTSKQISVSELCRNSYYRKPLLISIILQLSQQLAGNNVLINYSTAFFVNVGWSENYSQIVTCAFGAICAIMSVVALFLMEVAGRRKLLIISQLGTALSYTVATICFFYDQKYGWTSYLGIAAILSSNVMFQLGLNPIPYFITSELFTQGSVSTAINITGPINRIANCVAVFSFPAIAHPLYPYSLLPFVTFLVLTSFATYVFVPETKGRTIIEINREIHGIESEKEETTELLNGPEIDKKLYVLEN